MAISLPYSLLGALASAITTNYDTSLLHCVVHLHCLVLIADLPLRCEMSMHFENVGTARWLHTL